MATRAKKTPAKATDKPAASKKTAAKKRNTKTKLSTAKAASASAAKAKAATVSTAVNKSTTKRVLTPLEKIRSLHISTFISYVLLGLITAFLIGKASAEVLLGYQARDAFTNVEGVVLGSASEVLFNLEYRYVLLAALVIGAVGSLFLATKLRKRYENSVNAGISGFRWVIYGLTTALVVELVSFMAGVQDLMTLKVVAGLVLLAALLGWISERENKGASSPKRLAYYSSIFAYFLSLLPVIGSFIGTTFYGDERFGWHVYALAAVVLAGYVATLLVQKSSIVSKAKYEYVVFEQRYIRIDQTVKFLAVLILLAAIK